MRFNEKVIVVTGGSTGIGLATAQAFAKEGATVVIADVDDDNSMSAVRAITESGGRAERIICDVSRESDVASTMEEVVGRYGRIDCAFNNAGVEGTSSEIADYAFESWERVIGVNLTGVFLCMKHEIRQMLLQGGGAIVNNASILGTVGFNRAAAYAAAKHGVLGLTKVAALEYAARGIRVNSVCPGFVATPMLERAGILSSSETRSAIENLHPIHRLGRPEEIANAVLWLCSEEASFVHGQGVFVDGGYLAQ